MHGSRSEARFEVAVVPGAKAEQLSWDEHGQLKVRVAAPAADGKANRAVIALLATRLGVPRSHVSIVHGGSGRKKLIAVEGLTISDVRDRLSESQASRR